MASEEMSFENVDRRRTMTDDSGHRMPPYTISSPMSSSGELINLTRTNICEQNMFPKHDFMFMQHNSHSDKVSPGL